MFVYIGKNPRFTAFLDSNLHTRLAIVTENELGLAFPPRNLPKKFRPDPSTFYLVIVVTNRQTDKPTPVIPQSLAFAGITRTSLLALGAYSRLHSLLAVMGLDVTTCVTDHPER